MESKLNSTPISTVLLILVFFALFLYSYKYFIQGYSTQQSSPQPTRPTIVRPTNLPTSAPLTEKTLAVLIDEARTDLATRLQVDPSQISTKKVEERTWNDTSLGCPEPEMFYLQVITPGYQIILAVDEQEYSYHTSLLSVKLCTAPTD